MGYGPGLEIYRTWLYSNVPREAEGEKKRDYYTPEEIEALLQAEIKHPGIMRKFRRCIPRNLSEITQEEVAPAADCPKEVSITGRIQRRLSPILAPVLPDRRQRCCGQPTFSILVAN